jgi:hypothetical protein
MNCHHAFVPSLVNLLHMLRINTILFFPPLSRKVYGKLKSSLQHCLTKDDVGEARDKLRILSLYWCNLELSSSVAHNLEGA